jgi:hypothetical protein
VAKVVRDHLWRNPSIAKHGFPTQTEHVNEAAVRKYDGNTEDTVRLHLVVDDAFLFGQELWVLINDA